MKRIVAGGFLFLGGCIIFAVSMLGYVGQEFDGLTLEIPIIIGLISMILGIIIGVKELRKKD